MSARRAERRAAKADFEAESEPGDIPDPANRRRANPSRSATFAHPLTLDTYLVENRNYLFPLIIGSRGSAIPGSIDYVKQHARPQSERTLQTDLVQSVLGDKSRRQCDLHRLIDQTWIYSAAVTAQLP
jgi:hypothetical protein